MDKHCYNGKLRVFKSTTRFQGEGSVNYTEFLPLNQTCNLPRMIDRGLGAVSISSSLISCTSLQSLNVGHSKAVKETIDRSKSKRISTSIQKQNRCTLAPAPSRSTLRSLHEGRISRLDPMIKVTSSVVVASQLSPRMSASRTHSIASRERQSSPSKPDLYDQNMKKSNFSIFIPGITGKALCLSHLGEPSKAERSNPIKTSKRNPIKTFKRNKTPTSIELPSEYHKDRTKELDGNCWTGAKESCFHPSEMSDKAIGMMSSYESHRNIGKKLSTKKYPKDSRALSSPLDQSEQVSYHDVKALEGLALIGKRPPRKHRLDSHDKTVTTKSSPKAKSSNSSKNLSQKYSYIKGMDDPFCNSFVEVEQAFQPEEFRWQHLDQSDIGHSIRSPSRQNHFRKTTVRSTVSRSICSLPNLRECSDRSDRTCASAGSAKEFLNYKSPMDDKFKYMMAQLRLDREKADKDRQAVLKLKQNLHRGGSYDKVQKYLNKCSKGSINVASQHTASTMEHSIPELSLEGLLLNDNSKNEQELSPRHCVSQKRSKSGILASKTPICLSREELNRSIDV